MKNKIKNEIARLNKEQKDERKEKNNQIYKKMYNKSIKHL